MVFDDFPTEAYTAYTYMAMRGVLNKVAVVGRDQNAVARAGDSLESMRRGVSGDEGCLLNSIPYNEPGQVFWWSKTAEMDQPRTELEERHTCTAGNLSEKRAITHSPFPIAFLQHGKSTNTTVTSVCAPARCGGGSDPAKMHQLVLCRSPSDTATSNRIPIPA